MKIFVFGASGHAKVAIDILELSGYSIVGLIDDNVEIKGTEVMGYTVLGDSGIIPSLLKSGISKSFIAIGNNPVRVKIADKLENMGCEHINAIHPTSTISKHAYIGSGVMIGAKSIVNANAIVSNHVIINTNSIVEHDCFIDIGAHVCPSVNIAGTVHIGKCSMIGIGSTIIQSINIGDNTTIGASSVVVKDINSYSTAYGHPCKEIMKSTK